MSTTSTAPTSSRAAQVLILASLVVTAVVTAVSASSVWSDGGGFLISLYGVPLALAALLAVGVERANNTSIASLGVGLVAVVSLVWGVLATLGGGPFAAAPPLLLLVAAFVSWDHRRAARRDGRAGR